MAWLRRARHLAPIALIWLYLGLQLAASPRESPTVDEQAHLARGLTYLRTGDLRLYIGHPPLINVWAALPLLFDPRIQLPLDDPAWRAADWIEFPISLFWKQPNPALEMIAAGRLMIILLGALLLAAVYRLGADLGGPALGLAAMTLAVLDPNLRAHARLVTTDVGVTLCLTLCVWLWRRWLKHGGLRYALAAGGLLGLALASKYTAALYAPLLALVSLLARGAGSARRSGFWAQWLAALAAAGLVLWAVYAFEVRTLPALGFPAPLASYWDELFWSLPTLDMRSYLLGQAARGGFYLYFPLALLVKLPLPMLGLALAGLARALARQVRRRAEFGLNSLLWLPAGAYLAVAILTRINIGYRHLMPLWPLIYLAAGAGGLAVWRRGPAARLAVGLLAAWLVGANVFIYPRDLTYFNELAGGPDNGYRILVDSNLDWGQDLGELARYVERKHISSIRLSYFGSIPVNSIPVRQFPLPLTGALPPRPAADWHPLFPAPGWYAISVTHLWGGAVLDDPDAFAFFRRRRPEAILGRTIYIYNLPAEAGALAECVNPPPSLSPADVRRIFGPALQRYLQFDCRQGLPLPAGLTWYLLRGEQVRWLAPTLERLGARLEYDQPNLANPAFATRLYRLENPAGLAERYGDRPLAGGALGGLLAPLGARYSAPQSGNPARVETVWRVLATPSEPVSLFLHLTAADGFPLAIGDGFNTPYDALLPGDGLIQFHSLSDYPADLPPGAEFRTGLYRLSGDQARYRLPSGADYIVFKP